uniref:Uncharacterized protein n=1 Tax=Arundo donax TaxID=35708 RepID=A0A0A9DXJ9_ARUDO
MELAIFPLQLLFLGLQLAKSRRKFSNCTASTYNICQNPEDIFWTSIRTEAPDIDQPICNCSQIILYKVT